MFHVGLEKIEENLLPKEAQIQKISSRDLLSYFGYDDIKKKYLTELNQEIREYTAELSQKKLEKRRYELNLEGETIDYNAAINSMSKFLQVFRNQKSALDTDLTTIKDTIQRNKNILKNSLDQIKFDLGLPIELYEAQRRSGTLSDDINTLSNTINAKKRQDQNFYEGINNLPEIDLKKLEEVISELHTQSPESPYTSSSDSRDTQGISQILNSIKKKFIDYKEELERVSKAYNSTHPSALNSTIKEKVRIIKYSVNRVISEIQKTDTPIKSFQNITGGNNASPSIAGTGIQNKFQNINKALRSLEGHYKVKSSLSVRIKDLENTIKKLDKEILNTNREKKEKEAIVARISSTVPSGLLYITQRDTPAYSMESGPEHVTLINNNNGKVLFNLKGLLGDMHADKNKYGLENTETYSYYLETDSARSQSLGAPEEVKARYLWSSPYAARLGIQAQEIIEAAKRDRLTSYRAPGVQTEYSYTNLTNFYNGLNKALETYDLEAKNKRTALFGDLSYQESAQKESSERLGYQGQTKAFKIGLMHKFGQHFILGSGFGAQTGNIDYTLGRGDLTGRSLTGAIFAGVHNHRFSLLGALSYGKDYYDLTRQTLIARQSTVAQTHGHTHGVSLEARTKFSNQNFSLEPFARYRMARITINGYEEQGATTLDIKVDRQQNLLSEVELGSALSMNTKHFKLKLEGSWAHPAGENTIISTSALVGRYSDQKYKNIYSWKDKAYFNTGLSLTYQLKAGTSFQFQASKDFDSENTNNWQTSLRLLTQF